ncbi:hypothetical protein PISMIDRAFT_78006, partial [Pisolithus microcarpus 441]
VEKEHSRVHAVSRQISAVQQQDHDMLPGEAICSLADELEVKVQVIATTQNVMQEKVKKLLGSHKYYWNTCGTQLSNAIIHDKAHEVNEGDLSVYYLSAPTHKCQVAHVDPKYQEMTQDEKDKLLHALTEYQALKNASICAANSAVACDIQLTLEHIFKILDGLALHSGIYVCLFTTHGHVYDSSQPFWYGMDNVMDFWEDVLDVEPDELVQKLEQWACMQGKNIKECNSVEGMQWMCACILNPGLCVSIKEKYGIDLLGWLEGVLFQSPHAITSVEHLWTLHDALKAGMCHWAYMSRQQCLEYQDQLKEW